MAPLNHEHKVPREGLSHATTCQERLQKRSPAPGHSAESGQASKGTCQPSLLCDVCNRISADPEFPQEAGVRFLAGPPVLHSGPARRGDPQECALVLHLSPTGYLTSQPVETGRFALCPCARVPGVRGSEGRGEAKAAHAAPKDQLAAKAGAQKRYPVNRDVC